MTSRDYVAILRRSLREANTDHVSNLAAAVAYYAFLAIQSALLIAVGLFGLLANRDNVDAVVQKLDTLLPAQARTLITDSLQGLTERQSTGATALVLGTVLAFWSLSGCMQNLMWALNIVYDRQETRGFVRRRLAAFGMVLFAILGFALSFGVLVLGPHLSRWIGSAVDAKGLTETIWWAAEWPLLVLGLLLAFAGLLFLGPNVEHPRWRFLTFGAVTALAVWLVASGLFALYASKLGSYNKTWGALAAVVLLLTWLWLTAVALLLGAEINAEAERSRELSPR